DSIGAALHRLAGVALLNRASIASATTSGRSRGMKWPTPGTTCRSAPAGKSAISPSRRRARSTPSSPPCNTTVGTVIGSRRARRRARVLHVVAADRHEGPHALGREEGGDARGATAPVVAGQSHAGEAEGVHEVEQVLADRRLLRHPRRGGIEKARRPVPAQVG